MAQIERHDWPQVFGRPGGGGRAVWRKFTVFLVEDDPDDRDAVLRELRRSPFIGAMHWFRSGERLLRYFAWDRNRAWLANSAPALVLLDIGLPAADGVSVLARLRRHPLTTFIPVIMVTGAGSDEIKAKSWRLGANAYLSKPLDLARVHDVMQTGWSWPPLWAPPVFWD